VFSVISLGRLTLAGGSFGSSGCFSKRDGFNRHFTSFQIWPTASRRNLVFEFCFTAGGVLHNNATRVFNTSSNFWGRGGRLVVIITIIATAFITIVHQVVVVNIRRRPGSLPQHIID
jgi:hypothetical protein